MRDSSEVAFNLQAECNRLNSELSALREENERLKSESFEELYNAAIDERDALREELANAMEDIDTIADHNIDLQQRLVAAEQRNAELEKDAARWNFFSTVANDLQAFPHSWGKMTPEKMNHMCDEAMANARPTESGASDKCTDCHGVGQKCMHGHSAHPDNWYDCEKCKGSGKP